MLKPILAAVLTATLTLLPIPVSAAGEEDALPALSCKSAILMEKETGTVLYEQNSHTPLAPASVTKIMTMLLVMEALDSGAEDFVPQDDVFEVYTAPSDFSAVREALEGKGYTFLKAEVAMIPQNTVDISDPETVEKVNRFLENLEDNDDVQEVYHNGNLPEDDEEE